LLYPPSRVGVEPRLRLVIREVVARASSANHGCRR
jgi:hypothetical protein